MILFYLPGSRGDIYSGLSLTNDVNSSKLHSSYFVISSNMADRCYRRLKVELVCYACANSVPVQFGANKYFLVRKLYQETGGHMLTPKFGRSG